MSQSYRAIILHSKFLILSRGDFSHPEVSEKMLLNMLAIYVANTTVLPVANGVLTRCVKALFSIIMVLFLASCAGGQPYPRDLTRGSYYTVKKGDTLYSIGFRSGHGYKQLAAWNHITPPYNVFQGQKIRLLSKYKSNKSSRNKKINKKTSSISINNKKVLRLYWQWPVEGKLIRNFYHTGYKGIDISGHVGKKIRAAGTGVVVYSGSGLVGYGKLLIIKHNYLYLSAYAHNRRLLVKEGQKIKKGQVIAEMGVGVNGKPALHFEIRKNSKSVNPVNYLPK